MISIFVLALYSLISLILFHNFYYKRRKLPPGPTPLPLVGNLWSFMRNPPGDTLHLEWQKKYGPIYTMWFGESPIVCISEYSKIIETFLKDGETYAGRFNFVEFDKIANIRRSGVGFTQGDLWKEQRRFALHVLRDFGVGKNLMQERVITELETLCAKVDKDIENGIKEHDIASHIDIGIGSIINTLLFGYRFYGEKEAEFHKLKNYATDFFHEFGQMSAIMIQNHPYLRKLPFFDKQYNKMVDVSKGFSKFFGGQLEEHKQDFDEDEEATDFVGAFLKEKARRDKLGDSHDFNINQLRGMCFDLWVAGQETTSTTLAWGIAHLIHNLDVQEKLHEELDRVIGCGRWITVADRPQLPYTCAVINEVQRMANLVPHNMMHSTTRDVTVDGYFFPKGTAITHQVSAVLYDDQVFKEASKFDPTRFLDDKGQIVKCDELVPFGVGKRQCLGESLARMELFLFTANIFNHYRITPGDKMPSMERAMWFGESPVVCISEYSTIRETFQKDGDTYAGRWNFVEMDKILKFRSASGVVITDGDLWKDQRRFTLHVFRDFGLGKNSMQERVMTEVETLCEKVDKDIENWVKEQNLASRALRSYRIRKLNFKGQTIFSPLYANRSGFALHDNSDEARHPRVFSDFFEEHIEAHKQDFDEDEQATDFVGAFLKEKARRDKLGDSHDFTLV
ncbi:cytochrome p450 domain-containing protein [Ditylenchus destructor]|uniref:Cytochrome p450 domain-containing protein n=1 Tax=Ditylenchus destructor TaxID=166010 RepID=A0AAD4MUZ8_9BILA|nr:cytochrome p450 domain-containing protein [Ditylenchus destructor]